MDIVQKIRMSLAYKKMSESALARAMGSSPSAFHQRMKVGKFTTKELNDMATVMGAVYVAYFEFPDGTKA